LNLHSEQVSLCHPHRYECYHTPSPVHYNRDFCLLYSFFRDNESGVHMGICKSVKNVSCNPQPHFVRAEAFDTGFYIRKDEKNPEQSHVTFITQVDQKGNYPAWLTDNINENQAAYILNIRRAMNRILISEGVKTILLDAGMIFTVKTTFHEQALALWAFNRQDLNEVMTMSRTRRTIQRVVPVPGDCLYSNLGTEMLEVLADSDEDQSHYINAGLGYRAYTESGCEEIHRPACEHLHQQLMLFGLSPPEIPLPWPLWAVPSANGIEYVCKPSDAQVGDFLILKACVDCVVVVASCLDQEEELRSEEHINISSSLKYWPPSPGVKYFGE